MFDDVFICMFCICNFGIYFFIFLIFFFWWQLPCSMPLYQDCRCRPIRPSFSGMDLWYLLKLSLEISYCLKRMRFSGFLSCATILTFAYFPSMSCLLSSMSKNSHFRSQTSHQTFWRMDFLYSSKVRLAISYRLFIFQNQEFVFKVEWFSKKALFFWPLLVTSSSVVESKT